MKFGSCLKLSLPLIAASLLLVRPGPAGAGYVFTKIADSNGPFSSFAAYPALSASGDVGFVGSLDGGGSGVFRGNGGAITTIASTGAQFSAFPNIPDQGNISINASGVVAFNASLTAGGMGIFTGNGGAATTIVDTNGGGFTNVFGNAINSSGTVVFAAVQSGLAAVFRNQAGVISIVTGIPGHNPGGLPDINSSGAVVDLDLSPGSPPRGIYVFDGGTTTTIAVSTDPFFDMNPPPASIGNGSINDSNVVAFWGVSAAGGQGIFTGNGGPLTTVADSSGALGAFKEPAAINNLGVIAYAATFDAGGDGIFVGPDLLADKVIASGDPLFGSTVVSLNFFRGLNDSGQVAFYATLADGTQGIYRADVVVPEPSSVVLMGIGGLGLVGYLLRRRSRRT
jgi:hypothetical protein